MTSSGFFLSITKKANLLFWVTTFQDLMHLYREAHPATMEDKMIEARNLILGYGEHVRNKDLGSILDSLSDDATFFIPNIPVLAGKDAINEFYEFRFQGAHFAFDLTITDEKFVSDVIFINGRMERTVSPNNMPANTSQHDFSFILKRDDNDHLKIWQIRVV